jgi:hypothetical protein
METALQLFTLESPSYLSDTLATVPQMKSYYKWWFCLQLLRSLNAQPKDGQTYPPPAPCLTAFSFHRTRQPLRTLIVLLSQMSIIHGIGIIRFARTSIMLSMSLPISSRDTGHRLRLNSYDIQERIALFKVVNLAKNSLPSNTLCPGSGPGSCPGCSHAPALMPRLLSCPGASQGPDSGSRPE